MQCVCTGIWALDTLSLFILWTFGLNNWIQKESSPAVTWTSGNINARNNSRPLAIFQPISGFGWPKSILVSQISFTFSMGQQSEYPVFKKQPASFWCLFLAFQYAVFFTWVVIDSLRSGHIQTHKRTCCKQSNLYKPDHPITLTLVMAYKD